MTLRRRRVHPRRFLLHVLPSGFHRILPLLASSPARFRAHNIERVRQLLTASTQPRESQRAEADNETEITSDRPPMPMLRRPDDHHRYCPFEGARPAQSPSRTSDQDQTPHDRRRASRLANLVIAFPSSRAPEHKSADLRHVRRSASTPGYKSTPNPHMLPDRRGSSSSLAPSADLRAVGLRADACDLLAL